MGLSKAVVKNRVLILMIALILLVPAVFGMLGTRINYDMLDYLPGDMDTVIGQETLKEDFGKGAFSFIVVQDMPVQEVAQLKEKIQQVDHVESVLWYDSVADLSIPMELLPDKLYNEFNTDDATMLAVFFDSATSEDVTMDAIREIRSIAGKQCFVSGMSALVTDLKDLCEQEEPIFINLGLPHVLGQSLPFIAPICISTIQLGATVDYAILMTTRYKAERLNGEDKKKAVMTALRTSAPSIIVSGMGLFAATFGVALYSNIDIVGSMCMLMARGAIISVLLVLLVLPALLILCDGIVCRTTRGMTHLIGKQEVVK